jgi:hypothetical protein
MKKLFVLSIPFFALFLFGLSSCKKKDKSEIKMEYPIVFQENMEIDIENVDSFVVRETFPFPTFLDGELAKNNTSKDKVKSAKLAYLRMQIWDFAYSDSSKYSNLRDISDIILELNAEGLGPVKIASKKIPDIRTNAINLDLEDVDLKEYLKKDQFTMIIKYKKRRAMYHEMPFILSTKFNIVADPL